MPWTSYEQAVGLPGDKYDSGFSDAITLHNSFGQAAQVQTFTIGTAAAGTWAVEIEGVEAAFVADGADTSATIAAGLLEAIQSKSVLNGLATFSQASNVVTMASRVPNAAIAASVVSGAITLAQTVAPAAASPIPFGRAIVRVTPGDYTQEGYAGQGRLPSSAGDITGTQGILIAERDPTCLQPLGVTAPGYPANAAMTAGRDGRWIVTTEVACNPGDPVYVRHTANGALNKIGAFSNASGTGLALYGKAVWHKPISATMAVIQLNP